MRLKNNAREVIYMIHGKKLRFIGIFALCFIVIISFVGFLIWRSGILFRLDKQVSPDGKHIVQVFSKKGTHNIFNFSNEDIVHIYEQDIVSETEVTNKDGRVIKRDVTVQDGHGYYGEATYEGIWWAPDSKKYAIALRWNNESSPHPFYHPHTIIISDNETNSGSLCLSPQEIYCDVTNQNLYDLEHIPKCDYKFIKWGQDSESILIYYTCEENGFHDGYCWYNYKSGEITPCNGNE